MIDYAPGLMVAPLPDLFLLCSSWDKKSPGVIKIEFGFIYRVVLPQQAYFTSFQELGAWQSIVIQSKHFSVILSSYILKPLGIFTCLHIYIKM